MVSYDLTHLTQSENQAVLGPIQDDEALFLYAVIRGMRLQTIFEIGGLHGYSAQNFLKAVGPNGIVFTCDLQRITPLGPNHRCIHKNALHIAADDIENRKIELLFFDCHDYNVQMMLFHRLKDLGLIDDFTVLALHDTNTHPFKVMPSAYSIADGYVHQPVERKMVNDFVGMGYHAFALHTRPSKHDDRFPFRHGLTIMSRFKRLET